MSSPSEQPFNFDAAVADAVGTDLTQNDLNQIAAQLSKEATGATRLHEIKSEKEKVVTIFRAAIEGKLAALGAARPPKLEVQFNYPEDAILGGAESTKAEEFNFPPEKNPAFRLRLFLRRIELSRVVVAQVTSTASRPRR